MEASSFPTENEQDSVAHSYWTEYSGSDSGGFPGLGQLPPVPSAGSVALGKPAAMLQRHPSSPLGGPSGKELRPPAHGRVRGAFSRLVLR